MTKRIISLAFMTITLLFICNSARAQSVPAAPPPPPGPEDNVFFERFAPGPMGPDDSIGFVSFEAGLGEKTVAGAPFSASFSTQTTQTLSDGNQIQRNTTGTIARDSQGRTRRDMTLPAIGPWAASGKSAPQVAFINDPVAGAHYVLEADQKIARKMPAHSNRNDVLITAPGGRFRTEMKNETVTTSLGTKVINGISAEGIQYTRTIPAGEIGNLKPIVIVSERWYSAELQTVMLTKRSDPRMGETVFELTNIQRVEPAATLFQVPPDYTVKEGGMHGMHGMHGGHQFNQPLPPPAAE